MSRIIKKSRAEKRNPITQEKINQETEHTNRNETKHTKIPQNQYTDKVVDETVVVQETGHSKIQTMTQKDL